MKSKLVIKHKYIKEIVIYRDKDKNHLNLIFKENESSSKLYKLIGGFKKSAESGGQRMDFTVQHDDRSIQLVGQLAMMLNLFEYRGILDKKDVVKLRNDQVVQKMLGKETPLEEQDFICNKVMTCCK